MKAKKKAKLEDVTQKQRDAVRDILTSHCEDKTEHAKTNAAPIAKGKAAPIEKGKLELPKGKRLEAAKAKPVKMAYPTTKIKAINVEDEVDQKDTNPGTTPIRQVRRRSASVEDFLRPTITPSRPRWQRTYPE